MKRKQQNLKPKNIPGIVGFVCNWGAYSGVEIAGMEKKTYSAGLKIARVPCLKRLHMGLLLKAFELGADILMTADDYALQGGTMMNPTHFDTFILPYIREKAELTHQLGGLYTKHCDGNLWSTLDKLVGAGVDCVDPLEPVAGMDIGEVKEKYGDKLALQGNVDVSMLLPFGTPDEVKAESRRVASLMGAGGGYILAPSQAVQGDVPFENLAALLEVARETRHPVAVCAGAEG